MDLILIPGLWLDEAVWAETAAALQRAGHRVDALRRPGRRQYLRDVRRPGRRRAGRGRPVSG